MTITTKGMQNIGRVSKRATPSDKGGGEPPSFFKLGLTEAFLMQKRTMTASSHKIK